MYDKRKVSSGEAPEIEPVFPESGLTSLLSLSLLATRARGRATTAYEPGAPDGLSGEEALSALLF
jgi:hypothetical protein